MSIPFKMAAVCVFVFLLITRVSVANFGCMYDDWDKVLEDKIFENNDVLTISKCCSYGEHFNGTSMQCVKRPGVTEYKHVLAYCHYPPMDNDVAYWVPPFLRSRKLFVIKSDHEDIHVLPGISLVTTVSADEQIVNRLFQNKSLVLELFDKDPPSVLVQQYTCLEATDNPDSPYVLKTWLIEENLIKCCKKGEMLNHDLSLCIPRPGHTVLNTEKEIINKVNDNELYWLPKSLRQLDVTVFYKTAWTDGYSKKIVIQLQEDDMVQFLQDEYTGWTIFIPNIPNEKQNHLKRSIYCFDAVNEKPFKPLVILLQQCHDHCFAKCCLPGEIISKDGICVEADEEELGRSSIKEIIFNGTIVDALLPGVCMENEFQTEILQHSNVVAFNHSKITDSLRGLYVENTKHFKCLDWQRTADGVKEVIGTCVLPPNAWLYEKVRPLGAVAATLLAAAAVVGVVRKETRGTAHGRALVCHALCLAIVNALQVAWFFMREDHFDECSHFAYPTYFLMVAANFWLCAILGNMMHGFRQPMRALAGFSNRMKTWRRFFIMSIFAWGGSIILTAISVAMHHYDGFTKKTAHLFPTFSETKVCFLMAEGYNEFMHLGPLIYYYLPMSLLVGSNIVGVMFLGRKIQTLNRDQACLHIDHKSSESSRVKSALVYVKLLLMAGVLELGLELASWGARSAKGYNTVDYLPFYVEEINYNFAIAATFVDLARAASVLWLCTGRSCTMGEMRKLWTPCIQKTQRPYHSANETSSSNESNPALSRMFTGCTNVSSRNHLHSDTISEDMSRQTSLRYISRTVQEEET